MTVKQCLFYSTLVFFWGGVRGFGEAECRRHGPSRGAEGVGCGEVVSPFALEVGPWERTVPPPQKYFFSIFGLQITTFGALWGYFYGSVDCFGHRPPLHDSIMSVTGVIACS